jgi:hypothetical protein
LKAHWNKVSKFGATTVLSATQTVDLAGRVSNINCYQPAVAPVSSMLQNFDYTYDFNRVTKMTREKGVSEDEQSWFYDYDAKGQVLSADKRFTRNGTAAATANFLAGYQTQYTYDQIGNRLTSGEGGASSPLAGTGVRTRSYTANALNQYTAVNNPYTTVSATVLKQLFEITGRRTGATAADAIKISNVTTSSANPPGNASYEAKPCHDEIALYEIRH